MRKINLENYLVQVAGTTGTNQPVTINVKEWISGAIFHPDLKLGGREVILRGKLSDKIDKAEIEILLEETDYSKIKTAFETIKGFGKVHMEMLTRVLDAPLIEVKEDKK